MRTARSVDPPLAKPVSDLRQRQQAWEQKQAEITARQAQIEQRYISVEKAAEAVRTRLKELEEELTGSAHPSAQKLDQSLTHIERMLDEAVRAHASSDRVASAKEYAAAQLSEYRKRMDKETYEQTLESLFVKRLREDYGLPRLSLFYL